ncbi:MAG TPA: class II fructose-bisphosphate aldolase [Atribacteraceae bacterium]|nr:class II fructose-bisphosphate aldolase [Atribacteraceae bacterium]
MPLVTSRTLIDLAEKHNCAIPAFNTPHLEFMMWVLSKAEALRSPVMIQVAPVEHRYTDIRALSASLSALSARYTVPFSLHLDHAHQYPEIVEAIQSGFSSVMIDASRYSFEENVCLTRRVVEVAHTVNILVEGEIGRVGGLEGDESWENEESGDSYYTTTEEAVQFVRETGVDSLAVAVGTRHGLYSGESPTLNIQRVREIREGTAIPLVLHGGSGTPVEQLQLACRSGVRKINFSTILRVAFLRGLQGYLTQDNGEFFLPKIFEAASREVVRDVQECFDSCLSAGIA